ncbi:hypothetical protein [Mailhella massiliensis]|uniref:hypothetical protein n=1 Tax=Mailhella massiliensis TaxID=1903261 RepID=UPI0023F310BC|nr:hypothetical protein [Mailhella massiliensis]
MAGSFKATKAPPQTLERLDTWGTLDELPWSLDSSVWTTAGEYALTLSEPCKSGQSLTLVRKKVIALPASGKSGQSFSALRVRTDARTDAAKSGATASFLRRRPFAGAGSAQSGQELALLRVFFFTASAGGESGALLSSLRVRTASLSGLSARSGQSEVAFRVRCLLPAGGDVVSGGAFFALRIREDVREDAALAGGLLPLLRVRPFYGAGEAESGQTFALLRVRPLAGSGQGAGGEAFSFVRVRTTPLSGLSADTGQSIVFLRVRCIEPGPGTGAAGEVFLAEYKGWGWTPAQHEDGSWTQAQGAPSAPWREIPRPGDAAWVEVVQWQ